MKRRIDSKQTYLIPESYWGADRKGYRHVKGSEMHRILDKERVAYLKGEIETSKRVSRLPPDTKITKTDEGYKAKFTKKGKEQIILKWHREQYKDVTEPLALAGKWGSATIFGILDPKFWYRTLTEGVEAGRIEVAKKEYVAWDAFVKKDAKAFATSIAASPLYSNIVIPFVGGAALGKGLQLVKHTSLVTKLSTKIGTGTLLGKAAKIVPYSIVGGIAGAEVVPAFMKSPTEGAFASVRTAMRFGAAYKGIKWAVSSKPLASLKSLTQKIDISKVPFTKQIKSFMDYRADVRIAHGMRWPKQPLYGKGDSFLSSRTYGASRFLTTLEQMKGSLVRSGWRGTDPLRASAWQYFRSINVEPTLVPRVVSSTKFYMDKTGKILPSYNIFQKTPQLATGIMPKEFRVPKLSIRLSGISKGFKGAKFPIIGKGNWLLKSHGSKAIDATTRGLFRSFGKDVGYRYVTVKQLSDLPIKIKHVFKYPKLDVKPISVDKPMVTLWRDPVKATTIQTRFAIPPPSLSLRELESLEIGTEYIRPEIHKQFAGKIRKLTTFTAPKLGAVTISTGTLGQLGGVISDVRTDVIPDFKQATAPLTIPMVATGSILGMGQIQMQFQRQLQKLKTVAFKPPKLTTVFGGGGGIPKPPYQPPPSVPVPKPIILDFPELYSKRKKKRGLLDVKSSELIPYVKEHKVVKIEKLLSMKELKL